MKKMSAASVVLALLFGLAIVPAVEAKKMSEEEMQAMLDGADADNKSDAALDTTQNDEQDSDDAQLSQGGVADVAAVQVASEDEDSDDDGDFNPATMFAHMKKMQVEDPEGYKKMVEETQRSFAEMFKDPEFTKAIGADQDPEAMQAFGEMMSNPDMIKNAMDDMMKNPEALQAMMQGMDDEVLADVAADEKASELVNAAPQAAAAA